jgi:hypothetical protein
MQNNRGPSWAWVVPAALLLPGLQLAIFGLRFGHIDTQLAESLVFLPAGLIAAIALLYWLRAAATHRQRRATLIGYIIGLPCAFLGSLLLPLVLPAWPGATLGGSLPWLLCIWTGYRLAAGS